MPANATISPAPLFPQGTNTSAVKGNFTFWRITVACADTEAVHAAIMTATAIREKPLFTSLMALMSARASHRIVHGISNHVWSVEEIVGLLEL